MVRPSDMMTDGDVRLSQWSENPLDGSESSAAPMLTEVTSGRFCGLRWLPPMCGEERWMAQLLWVASHGGAARLKGEARSGAGHGSGSSRRQLSVRSSVARQRCACSQKRSEAKWILPPQ
jgi:hypothetical protein